MRPGHPALHHHSGFLLRAAAGAGARRFRRRLEPLGLHPRHYAIMCVLDESGPSSQQALGRALGVDPSTVVAMLDELEQRGVVERRRDPRDRRAHAVHLTTAGRSLLADARRAAEEAERETLAGLDERERETLRELLVKLLASTDES